MHDEARKRFGGAEDTGYGHVGGRARIEALMELHWTRRRATEEPHDPF